MSVQYACPPGMVIVRPLFVYSVLDGLKGVTSGVLIPLHMLKYQVLGQTRSLLNLSTTASTLPNVAMLELQNEWVAIVIWLYIEWGTTMLGVTVVSLKILHGCRSMYSWH